MPQWHTLKNHLHTDLAMLTLAGHIFGCIFWGFIIALILCAITFLIAQGLKGNGVRPVLLIVILPFLLWQTVLGTRAIYARSYASDVEELIESIESHTENIDMKDAAREVQQHFPQIPEKFIEVMASENVKSGISVAKEAASSIRHSLSVYTLKRAGYALIFMAAGVILLVRTAGSGRRNSPGRHGHHKAPPRQRYLDDLD